jgi:hypothetical protein
MKVAYVLYPDFTALDDSTEMVESSSSSEPSPPRELRPWSPYAGAGPSRITPRTWSADTGFHGNATKPQVAPAAA